MKFGEWCQFRYDSTVSVSSLVETQIDNRNGGEITIENGVSRRKATRTLDKGQETRFHEKDQSV